MRTRAENAELRRHRMRNNARQSVPPATSGLPPPSAALALLISDSAAASAAAAPSSSSSSSSVGDRGDVGNVEAYHCWKRAVVPGHGARRPILRQAFLVGLGPRRRAQQAEAVAGQRILVIWRC